MYDKEIENMYDGITPAIYKLKHHEPIYETVKYSDFKRLEVHEKYQYKKVPYIDMNRSVELFPLTADKTDCGDYEYIPQSMYEHDGRMYADNTVFDAEEVA